MWQRLALAALELMLVTRATLLQLKVLMLVLPHREHVEVFVHERVRDVGQRLIAKISPAVAV